MNVKAQQNKGYDCGILYQGHTLFLQNSVHKNFRFSTFSSLLKSRKGLTADGRHAVAGRFLLRRDPAGPLRLFQSEENGGFLLAVFVLKSYRFAAVRPSRECGGGLIAVQRGPRCNAAGVPRQSREGLTARRPPPRHKTAGWRPFVYSYE